MPIRLKHKAVAFAPQKVSKSSPRWWLWARVILFLITGLFAGLFSFPDPWNKTANFISENTPINLPEWNSRSFRLGLDLLGGSELVYEAELAQIGEGNRDEAVSGVRDVIERRVNAMGVSEPVVQTVETRGAYRVIVQLAGIRNVNDAINEIGETPVLEFKEESSVNPEMQSEQAAAEAEARTKVDEIERKLRANPRIDFSRLASEAVLTVNDLGFVNKNTYPELWAWANEHTVGNQTEEAIETSAGWNFVKLTGERDGGKEVEASHILICFRGATRCERDTSKEDARRQIEDLKNQANGSNFADLAKNNSTETGAVNTGGSLGWFGMGQMIKPFEDAAFAMNVGDISDIVETEFGFHIIYKTGERNVKDYSLSQILVSRPSMPGADNWVNTGLSGKHLTSARVEFDPNSGEPIVSLSFNDEGKTLFQEITARNVGKRVAIFLDGGVISAPTVQQEIIGGDAIITNIGGVAEAKLLSQRLNAGALPVPIRLVSQQTVGATLGQDSLEKSLFAGLIGFALVALFMIAYYRVPGLVAVISLGIYIAFVLALFKLIPVTLTLAGIAGFILSIGMAVDANVLIFERMKEELRAGHSLSSAVAEGARRAWPSIRDGNYTTLISALVLFWFSSSVIKGFALTLGIGVLMSMFSALFISQSFLSLIAAWRWKKWPRLFAWK